MSDLVTAVCSITPTQRRRFFWAVWWTGAPRHTPFRKPDAANGGAHSMEEALAEAEQKVGRHVLLIEPYWARAWTRVLRGEAPPAGPPAAPDATTPPRPRVSRTQPSAWAVVGVKPGASLVEVKRAFRQQALTAHPDQGGDPEVFLKLQRAYEKLCAKLDSQRRRPR